jgi:hypothetical protein
MYTCQTVSDMRMICPGTWRVNKALRRRRGSSVKLTKVAFKVKLNRQTTAAASKRFDPELFIWR